jgi:hypothetical protein
VLDKVEAKVAAKHGVQDPSGKLRGVNEKIVSYPRSRIPCVSMLTAAGRLMLLEKQLRRLLGRKLPPVCRTRSRLQITCRVLRIWKQGFVLRILVKLHVKTSCRIAE